MKRFLAALAMSLIASFAIAAVNINSATKEELDVLPGIGPVKAQAIVDYRKAHGPFKSVEDLKKVNGIGDATFDKIKGDLSVTGSTTRAASPATPAPAKPSAAATPAISAASPAPAPAAKAEPPKGAMPAADTKAKDATAKEAAPKK